MSPGAPTLKQNGTYEASGRSLLDRDFSGWGKKVIPPVAFFAVAFAIDMLTNQQYSSIWGSAAIVASVIWLFPTILPAIAALGTYAAVWIGFNLVRAFADDADIALASKDSVATWEHALFGGTLPSARLQEAFFNAGSAGPHDILLSLIHGSFFVVPFVTAAITWWKYREHFRAYTIATAITFAIGLVGFLLLPTAPPWLAEPEGVDRVTHSVLAGVMNISGVSGTETGLEGGFRFEPNHFAAMPSVHVAATVLVYLLARRLGPSAAAPGLVYALAMTFGVVYLGEHYVIDAFGGWLIALAGWMIIRRVTGGRFENGESRR